MAPFDLKEEILRLKEERNAIILAHSYQTGDIQDMADYVGDSLGLAYKAQNTDCDVIAFCGVHFMAETAKILNPDKTVILPDADAGCSLEASCDAGELEAFLKENAHKNYYVVAYVNCSIGVKALADVIVTSGNAVKIVSQAPEDRPILFPGVPVVAHPECTEAVRLLADHICSTEKMIPYCTENPAKSFIIVTESGILHRLRKLVPGKEFIPAPTEQCSCSTCPYMKMNTLEKLYLALRDLSPAVELPEDLRRRAEAPLLRMLEQSQS